MKSKDKSLKHRSGIIFALLVVDVIRTCLGENALSFDVEGDAIPVGRCSANDIQIHDKHVSRNHLAVWKKGNRFLLKDLGNGNGTVVNGHPVPYGATVERISLK